MVSDAQKKASAKWDKENMVVLACKVKRETAEQFKAACAAQGTTSNAVLQQAVKAFLDEHPAPEQPHTTGNAAPSLHSTPEEMPGEMQSAMDVLKASSAAQIAGIPDEMQGPAIQPDDDTEARRAALLESIKRL